MVSQTPTEVIRMKVSKVFFACVLVTVLAAVTAWSTATSEEASTGPDVITVLGYDYEFPEYSLLGSRPAIEYAEQQTNVKIEWQLVPDGERADRIALLIAAGGDLPDLFQVLPPDMTRREAAEKGITLPWSDFIDAGRMPKVAKFLAQPENQGFVNQITDAETGKIYYLPRMGNTSLLYWSDYVRGDWLAKLDIEDPETIDDYRDYLQAAVTRDPNGNGQADEVGWANFFSGAGWTSMLNRSFGLGGLDYFPWDNDWAVVDGGSITFIPTDERFRALLEWVNGLWEAGLIHPDQFNFDSPKFNTLSTNNTLAGLNQWPENIVPIGEQLASVEPTATYHAIAHPIDPRYMTPADRKYARLGPALWSTYLSAKSENIDAVLRFVDFTLGDPDFPLIAEYGIEGVHHRVLADGTREYIGELADLDTRSRYFYLGTVIGYLPHQFRSIATTRKVANEPEFAGVRDWNERVKQYLHPTIFWQLTATQNDVIRAATRDIRAFIDESVTKFIIGSKPLDEWDSYVATIEEEAGAEIQAAIEVRQAYFDQHLRASY